MAQVTIYLDTDHEQRLRRAAADANMSLSSWIASLIDRHTRAHWPAEVRQSAGSWQDLPPLAVLREPNGSDIPREPL